MLYLIAILLATVATTMANSWTVTPIVSQMTMAGGIDPDAKLQRSIDLQVLAEIKAERVLQYCNHQMKHLQVEQYCDNQLTRHMAARKKGKGTKRVGIGTNWLSYKLSSLAIKRG
ncbi:hypothetical protein BGX38DRAFT_748545 [Terfezia claveryi]|nr:hypothetical protein BGX38DRAFT_748545 [Terfezia claveryi]